MIAPEPIGNYDHVERTRLDLDTIRSAEFVPDKPITLHEAMARAIAYNLRYRIAEIEREVAEAELEKSNYELLPTLDVKVARDRNNVQISNSDDRIANTASATFAWDILDLGVSYARANQRADEVLIKQEQERKAVQDIIRRVNTAFWRAAAGQRLLTKVHAISRDLQVAMAASHEMERSRATDAITAVAFRRDVVESVKQALAIRRELREAKAELAELLNIRQGFDFELALPPIKATLTRMPMSVKNLEIFALENRPELRIEKYNERIGDWQAREALYNLLPGLKVSAGQNYSSESTNLSPNWISTGVNMGMNLFQLFSGQSEYEIGAGKAELARHQRLALSVAVLAQVHMSRIKFKSAAQQMRLAYEIAESDRKLTRLVRTDGQFFNNDFFEAVRLATQQIRSEMDEQRAYVELVSARADLMHAIGLDVFPDTVNLNDLPALSDSIRAMMLQWDISDETQVAQTETLPLDHLVNNMITHDPRTDEPESGAAGNLQAKAARGKIARVTDTLFTAGPIDPRHVAAHLPELPQSDESTPAFEPEAEAATEAPAVDKAEDPANGPEISARTEAEADPASGPVAGLPGRVDADPPRQNAEQVGAPPSVAEPVVHIKKAEKPKSADVAEEISPETIARLNRIAPASNGNRVFRAATDRRKKRPGAIEWDLFAQPKNLPVAPALRGRYLIQFGAFPDRARAHRLFDRLTNVPMAMVDQSELKISFARDRRGRDRYFVHSDAYRDRSAAAARCTYLRSAAINCLIAKLVN